MNNFFDNKRILNSIWKWKKHILIVLGITVLVSAIISGPYIMEPKYKSTARVYPVNITEASEESESEHLLEFLQSHDIKFRVIDEFNLDKVYKISKEEKLFKTWILYEFNQNVSFKKTDFETIEIKVLDTDPQRAHDMVDSIIVYLNEFISTQRSLKHKEFAENYKKDLAIKQQEIDSVFHIVEQIRKSAHLVDYYAQAEPATLGLMESAARGGDKSPATKMLDELVNNGGNLRFHQDLLETYETHADTIKKRLDKEISFANRKVSYTRVVEHPFVADKKAWPIRWLIVFLAVVGVSIMSVITVSLIDYLRELKQDN